MDFTKILDTVKWIEDRATVVNEIGGSQFKGKLPKRMIDTIKTVMSIPSWKPNRRDQGSSFTYSWVYGSKSYAMTYDKFNQVKLNITDYSKDPEAIAAYNESGANDFVEWLLSN